MYKSAVKGKGYEDGDSLNLGDAAAIALKVVGEAGKKGSDPEARTPWIAETAKEKPDLLPWNIRLRPRGTHLAPVEIEVMSGGPCSNFWAHLHKALQIVWQHLFLLFPIELVLSIHPLGDNYRPAFLDYELQSSKATDKLKIH